MAKVKAKRKKDEVVFETYEDYLNIFIELLVKEAQECDFTPHRLRKFVVRRINEICN